MANESNPLARRDIFPWLIALGLLIVAIVWIYFGGGLALIARIDIVAKWLAVMALMILGFGLIGYSNSPEPGKPGRWLGVLIDSSYRMSMSRLQIALWTVLALSAWLVIVLPRLLNGPISSAMQVSFPNELILAMGISLTSFAGSSLIQSNKQQKTVNLEARSKTTQATADARNAARDARDNKKRSTDQKLAAKTQINDQLNTAKTELKTAQDALANAGASVTQDQQKAVTKCQDKVDLLSDLFADAETDHRQAAAELEAAEKLLADEEKKFTQMQEDSKVTETAAGILRRNTDIAQAHWLDLFRGDEVGNYKVIDISKVQMFFFTMVVIFAYGVNIATLLRDATAMNNPVGVDLPAFSNTLNTLLGISHGTYLSVKAFDHTEVAK